MASTGIRRSRRPAAVAATVVAGIVAPIVAGCAAVPSENAPRQVLTGGNAAQAYVRPLPPPGPRSVQYAKPIEVVRGFLAASASYVYDPAAAMQFLSPSLRKTWQPGTVTVVSSSGEVKPLPYNPSLPGSGGTSVEFTVQNLATLNQSGQYEYSSGTTPGAAGEAATTYTFHLEQQKGVWLITGLPQGGDSLLLTQASFQEVYQPRNLFFFAHRQQSVVNRELVPDPVYAPVQSADSALNTDVARGLVKGLLNDRLSWLSGATSTAFPAHTKLLKVTISGQMAVVNLGGAAAGASPQQVSDMNAQLLATLASQAYSSPLAHDVVLEINGRQPYTGPNSNLVSPVSTGPLIYESELGAVNQLYSSKPLVPAGQIDPAQVTVLAATNNGPGSSGATAGSVQTVALAARSRNGCTVFVYAPGSPATGQPGVPPNHSYPLSGGECTSLSFDRSGNLWAAVGGHIWMLPARTSQWLSVRNPENLPPDGKSGPRILSLQVAPDGVRAALLIATPSGNRVMLAAIVTEPHDASLGSAVPVWSGSGEPTSLSWYSAYDLAVLAGGGIWQVPLTGGPGRLLGNAPGGAVSLTSDGVTLVVGIKQKGTESGKIEISSTTANSWQAVPNGTLPAYSSLIAPNLAKGLAARLPPA